MYSSILLIFMRFNSLEKGGHTQFNINHSTIVDYENRCACMLLYDKNLSIIPFSSRTHTLYSEDEMDLVELKELQEESHEKANNSYTIHLPSLGIRNVKDIKFLHGYYEPTLMILYEPIGAWVGRLEERRNTHSVAILSLNLEQQQHHLIWTASNLPHDCYRIMPLKSPGGACLLSPNAIMYLNQSSRYKLILNLFGDEDTEDPMALKFNCEESPMVISLDNAQTTFLHDYAVLVSIQSGELFVMNLLSDGRSIVHINLQKLGTSINATCMCTLSHRYLFVGSKFENSVLIKYFPKKDGQMSSRKKRKEAAKDSLTLKKKEVSNEVVMAEENIVHDFIDPEDMDDDVEELVQAMLESKTLSRREKVKKTRWVMNVVDSLVCTSPISDIKVKGTVNNEEDGAVNMDLLACNGFGTGGSLSVFRKGIRTSETISFDMYSCEAMWALCDITSGTTKNRKRKATDYNEDGVLVTDSYSKQQKNYLLISKEEGTSIFETGEELVEKTMKIPIESDRPTVNAGNMFYNECIIQVHNDRFILIDGDSRVQEEEFDVEISWSYILDPFVVFLLCNNEIILYKASYDKRRLLKVSLPETLFSEDERIQTVTLFNDESKVEGFNYFKEENNMEIEEDQQNGTKETEIVRPYYLSVVNSQSELKIYNLKSFECVLQCSGVNNGRSYIENETNLSDYWNNLNVPEDIIQALPKIVEMKIVNLGSVYKLPYMFFILENGDILIYSGFSVNSAQGKDVSVRFKRVLAEAMTFFALNNRDDNYDLDDDYDITIHAQFPRIIPFDNINEKSGVFVCGKTPIWIFSEKDYLRAFEMTNQGSIHSFSPIQNNQYHNGFVFYSNTTNVLNFSQLDPRWSLELPSEGITVYKAPLRATPTSMVYWPEENVIVVMVYKREKDMVKYLIGGADDRKDKDLADFIAEGNDPPQYDPNDVDPRYPIITEPKYEMLVLNGSTYEIEDSFKLKDEEAGIVKRIYLKYSNDKTQRLNSFIAVGGSSLRGEDTLSKGRVALFDIGKKNRTKEDGTIATFSSLSQRCSKDFRYAVTEIDSVGGVLCCAVGHRIYLLTITKTSDLVEIAFVDTQIYTVSMCTIKNYILYGDIRRSISLLRWREDERTLLPLGKDYGSLSVYATGLLVDNNRLIMVVADDSANVFFYEYSRSIENHAGHKLLCIGDFHLGTHVNGFLRLKLRERGSFATYCSFYGGTDGSVGYITPMTKECFQRLGKLEMRLVSNLSHFAGLNPKAFRLTKTNHMYQNHKRSVIDGELLRKFSTLERTKQDELSRLVGSSRKTVIEDLYGFEDAKKIFE